MTDTVEVPVEIINSDVLTKNNLTYAVVGKSTTTVQYEVKTTNAYRIRSSDFRAYADMTDMWSVTGAIPIKVEVLNHSEYLVSMPVSRTGTIKIETEPLQRKTFTIGVMTTGMLEDGYQTGQVTLSPGDTYGRRSGIPDRTDQQRRNRDQLRRKERGLERFGGTEVL